MELTQSARTNVSKGGRIVRGPGISTCFGSLFWPKELREERHEWRRQDVRSGVREEGEGQVQQESVLERVNDCAGELGREHLGLLVDAEDHEFVQPIHSHKIDIHDGIKQRQRT